MNSYPRFDVTQFLRALRAGGDPIAGFNIRSGYEDATIQVGWNEKVTFGGRLSTSITTPPASLQVIYKSGANP